MFILCLKTCKFKHSTIYETSSLAQSKQFCDDWLRELGNCALKERPTGVKHKGLRLQTWRQWKLKSTLSCVPAHFAATYFMTSQLHQTILLSINCLNIKCLIANSV